MTNSYIYQNLMIIATMLDGKKMHIMLADDDVDDRENFIEALQELAPHIKVSAAPDGAKLMSTLKAEGAPDILFLDLNMPLKNGLECLEEIRKHAKLQSIPVIIYSTSSNPELINNTYEKGANLYIEKPQSFKEIKKIMQKVLLLDIKNLFPQPPKSKFVLRVS